MIWLKAGRSTSVRAFVFIGLLLIGLMVGAAPALAAGTWGATGSMTTARSSHTATLLNNGQVLVAGGCCSGPFGGATASAEVYNAATSTWSPTGSMTNVRANHTATLLADGKVLVAGGDDQIVYGTTVTASAEVDNPATGTWSSAGGMATARSVHVAVLLADGRVLVAGGGDQFGNRLASAETYNPATNTWSATGSMATARTFATATLLSDGRVLVAGGGTSGAELYNPTAGTWSPTGSMATARSGHTASLLSDGRVLAAGGGPVNDTSSEIYTPATGTWSATGNMVVGRAGSHAAAQLADGRVLVSGGVPFSTAGNTAEIYTPATGTWSATGNMTAVRRSHPATLLTDGRVLAAGGITSDGMSVASAELFTP